jgi:pimeloyl-ACP methyl ester carboxylesterase
MAAFSLVHGAWHGGWAWDLVAAELRAHGHVVHAPDLPCDDVDAGIAEYAAGVPEADVLVGHSLGGLTIPRVPARLHVFLCALVPGVALDGVFVPGFGDARVRDELGRSYYPDPADAARELQYPAEHAHLADRLRRQAPVRSDEPLPAIQRVYVVTTRDAAIEVEWQRKVAREVLGVEPVGLDAGHSPMLECPRELAELLESSAREAGVV